LQDHTPPKFFVLTALLNRMYISLQKALRLLGA
jgi:hypothetical protein